MKSLPIAALALALPLSLGLGPAPAGPESVTFDELGLTLTLPELEGMTSKMEAEGQTRASWSGKLGASEVKIRLVTLEGDSYGLRDPEGVLELMEHNIHDPENSVFAGTGLLEGNYGYICYAATGRADHHVKGTTRLASDTRYLCGMLDGSSYVVQVDCEPPLSGKDAKPIDKLLEQGIEYAGEVANIRWTDEEAIERYMRDTPEDCHDEMEKILRTDHYIILTNSSGGKAFAKEMERGYDYIQKIFPFEEVGCRRLMPVFLFQNRGEYYDFCKKITGGSMTNSKGHAWKDYYATWYEAPKDPVHIHEATHQIFANRLGLSGGGSWFQEGVAEYIETRDNDRNAIATQVKKGRSMPLRDFFQVRSLINEGSDDVKGGNQAGDLYKMAALFIEFMRESKFGKEHFDVFVHKMGAVPRSDIERIEAVFQELYDVTIDELEVEWKKYCKKR